MKSNNVIGAILLTLAASIWGGMFVVVKSIVGEIPPVELVWLRYLTAFICLVIVSLLMKVHWRFNAHDLVLIILIGILGNTISLVTQETGTWLSNAQTGSVITTSTPMFIILFAWLLLKERLTWIRICSIAMASCGVIIIVGLHLTGTHLLLGILSLLVSSCTWALASILIKKLSSTYNAMQITILSTLVALIILTPWIGFRWSIISQIDFLDPKVLFCIFYLGCISTASAYIMWDKGLALMDADSSGMFYLIQPVVGSLLGWFVLDEQISTGFIVGTLFILGSVYVYLHFDR